MQTVALCVCTLLTVPIVAILWILISSLHVHSPSNGPGVFSGVAMETNTMKKCQLLIAVLSARNHSQLRNAIRQSWFPRNYSSNSSYCVEAKFVVGQRPCTLPPEDRLDIYDCEPWKINTVEVGNSTTVHFSSLASTFIQDRHNFASMKIGIRFKVQHPVLVTKLGISSSIVTASETANVVLQTTATKEVIAIVRISPQQTGVLVNGYIYRSVEPVILPKGFEGTLMLSTSTVQTSTSANLFKAVHDDAGGLLNINQVLSGDGIAHPFHPNDPIAVSFGYSIYDFETLNTHIMQQKLREDEWNSQLAVENSLLHDEMLQHDDIILVDTVDIYRNLPLKLLAFYELAVAQNSFEFLLKTDDDCILQIERIVDALQTMSENQKSKMFWWGRFRHNWLVEHHGKWQELNYGSMVYPPFACGVAYVLSSDVVQWLTKNRHELHSYQGEDVSLGIWLSAIGPNYFMDTRWQCDEGCQEETFSRGQLNPYEIQRSWNFIKKCGNFCYCDTSHAYKE